MGKQGRDIMFMLLPTHLGILGNERVDKLAKEAVKREAVEVKLKLSKSEGRDIVWKKAMQASTFSTEQSKSVKKQGK